VKSPSAAARRFGQEVMLEGGARALQWVLQRNCSITPRQLGAVYLSLCVLAATISAGFWWQGARLVTAFASVEIFLVGLALLAYARHASDRDVLTLAGRRLAVEQLRGTRLQRAHFNAEWITVEPAAGQGSLVALTERGQLICVGRFLRPEMRSAFAQELRGALRRAAQQQHDSDSN
jgi:uncharacterized membrane protein